LNRLRLKHRLNDFRIYAPNRNRNVRSFSRQNFFRVSAKKRGLRCSLDTNRSGKSFDPKETTSRNSVERGVTNMIFALKDAPEKDTPAKERLSWNCALNEETSRAYNYRGNNHKATIKAFYQN
jgi:hypothetical protein